MLLESQLTVKVSLQAKSAYRQSQLTVKDSLPSKSAYYQSQLTVRVDGDKVSKAWGKAGKAQSLGQGLKINEKIILSRKIWETFFFFFSTGSLFLIDDESFASTF